MGGMRLLQLRGVVEAPPDEVAAVLLDVRPGGRSPLARRGTIEDADGDDFTLNVDGSRLTVTVDRAARTVSQQGEFWYRGVTRVEPDPRGALVVHEIFNVADGHRWAVGFLARGPVRSAPGTFREQLAELGRDLHCAAWLIED
jgi:hypothetical protein